MSSYLNFFIRNKNEFLPIGSFCRSSEVYRIGNLLAAPYEKVTALNQESIKKAIDYCRTGIESYKDVISDISGKINFLMGCNDSLESKLGSYEDYLIDIQDCKKLIADITYAENYFNMLSCILSDIEYCDDFDCSRYIYFGIEISHDCILPENIIEETKDVN